MLQKLKVDTDFTLLSLTLIVSVPIRNVLDMKVTVRYLYRLINNNKRTWFTEVFFLLL